MDKKRVLQLIDEALGFQFSNSYSWENMIDDVEKLSAEEKAWAKKHIIPKASFYINE